MIYDVIIGKSNENDTSNEKKNTYNNLNLRAQKPYIWYNCLGQFFSL